MSDRPILFSGEMVRAILEGRKTQTRRIMKVQPTPNQWVTVEHYHPIVIDRHGDMQPGEEIFGAHWNDGECGLRCPYGAPSDLLWVRETWCLTRDTLDWETGGDAASYEWNEDMYGDPLQCLNGDGLGASAALHYPADGEDNTPSEMWPCIGLNGKVLRKKEIRWRPSIHMPRWASRITLRITDIRVERLQDITEDDARAEGVGYKNPGYLPGTKGNWIGSFAYLWNKINGPGAWEANPWVWVVSFERVKP
jgi:hypothetical protein